MYFTGHCGFLRNTLGTHVLQYNISESGLTAVLVRCTSSEIEYIETVKCRVDNVTWSKTPCGKGEYSDFLFLACHVIFAATSFVKKIIA